MIVSAVGETATVDDPDFGKGVRVSLDELFTSAKGEDCKRGTVLSGQREAEVIVICKDDKGRWNMRDEGLLQMEGRSIRVPDIASLNFLCEYFPA